MKKQFFVIGFEAAKGVSKTSNKEYEYCRLVNLTAVQKWDNDKGKSFSDGFTVDTDKQLKGDLNVRGKLMNCQFPCWVDAEIDIDPEDMTKTILVDIYAHYPLSLDKPCVPKAQDVLAKQPA